MASSAERDARRRTADASGDASGDDVKVMRARVLARPPATGGLRPEEEGPGPGAHRDAPHWAVGVSHRRPQSGNASAKAPPPVAAHVLLIEPEPDLATRQGHHLRVAGFRVDVSADPSAHPHAGGQRYDLVVIDLPLPNGDGLAMLERLLQRADVPVVVISATADEVERVCGLDLGADDFVSGPVSAGEFAARIRSVLRRRRLSIIAEEASTLTAGGLTVDPVSRRVAVFGAAITLTALEFELLLFFMRHPGQVLSRGLLLRHVWGRGGGDGSTVTVRVRRLREKIEADPANPRLITTVWGIGYRFSGSPAVPGPTGQPLRWS